MATVKCDGTVKSIDLPLVYRKKRKFSKFNLTLTVLNYVCALK